MGMEESGEHVNSSLRQRLRRMKERGHQAGHGMLKYGVYSLPVLCKMQDKGSVLRRRPFLEVRVAVGDPGKHGVRIPVFEHHIVSLT